MFIFPYCLCNTTELRPNVREMVLRFSAQFFY